MLSSMPERPPDTPLLDWLTDGEHFHVSITGAPAGHLPFKGTWMKSMALGRGNNGQALLACGGSDPEVRLCEPDPGKPVWKSLVGHDGKVTSVAFGHGTKGQALLASGGSDGTVRLWDPDDGRPVGEPLIAHKTVNTVAFGTGAEGRVLLASGGHDETEGRSWLVHGSVRLWDRGDGRPVGEPLIGQGVVHSLAFGPGARGRVLLAAGGYNGIWLWDPDDGTLVGQPLTGHEGGVDSVAFVTGAGGQLLLASAGRDRTVRLWDPLAGVQLMLIRRRVPVAALTSDESILAIGDSEGLTVIDTSACGRQGRDVLRRGHRSSPNHSSLVLRVANWMKLLTALDAVKTRKRNRR